MSNLKLGVFAILTVSMLALLVGGAAPRDQRGTVVVTTPILADFTRQIAKDRLAITQLIPNGADPHTFEPRLADVKAIASAKAAISNNLLLEEQRLIKAIDANLPKPAPHLKVAETAVQHGIRLIPLVENAALDTVWLGLRVIGGAKDDTASIRLVGATGPGSVAAFTTGTFGQPTVFWNSSDGFGDEITLPTNAHTHLSWAFSAPGSYQLNLETPVGPAVLKFAVGVDPNQSGTSVINKDHHDLAIDLNQHRTRIVSDTDSYQPDSVTIHVPNQALAEVPADPSWRFLGRPGAETYILAQAVLGKHVHGEIDPHAWLDVKNAIAYVSTITELLTTIDPSGREEFAKNAESYIAKLRTLDRQVTATLAAIPEGRRNLVTTHDGYGYLAKAYGLNVAGFVTPNPAMKPSATSLVILHRSLAALQVPAVFLEPNQANRRDLIEVAASESLAICEIHSDTFTDEVASYLDLMTTNAKNVATCLTKEKP